MKLFSTVHLYLKCCVDTRFKVSIPVLAPTFLTLAVLSVFCLHLLVVCLLFCLSLSLLPLFVFLWGRGSKPSPFYFFLQRLLNISVLHFLSLFCAPSLFFSPSLPGPFDVSADSLSFRLDELTDLDAQALAQSLFLY